MAQRAIREYDAKRILADNSNLTSNNNFTHKNRIIQVTQETNWDALSCHHPWLTTEKLVVKPDQLIGKRGKNNLLLLNADQDEARQFIDNNIHREIQIGKTKGKLSHFLIEPYIPHEKNEELYVSISTGREKDTILFSLEGGIDIENNWEHITKIDIPIGVINHLGHVTAQIPMTIESQHRPILAQYLYDLYHQFIHLDFTFLEINPLLFTKNSFHILDCKARLDDTALFQQTAAWNNIQFPENFGYIPSTEEQNIKRLDEKTGASLKLTLLNPKGRIWMLVAGGGASVIYADTITQLGHTSDMANYGEYSGNPSADELYEYTSTILNLMTREALPNGQSKILLIGGGIANFTDVSKTFIGIINALRAYKEQLITTHVKIYVRRGGPNYKEALTHIKALERELGIHIEVYGPETHMTKIVRLGIES
jgi:ATP-citrate lyase beta-subunit